MGGVFAHCRLRFWVDIIAWLPFDYAIIEALYPPCYTSNTARWLSLLKLLRLVRGSALAAQWSAWEPTKGLVCGQVPATLAGRHTAVCW